MTIISLVLKNVDHKVMHACTHTAKTYNCTLVIDSKVLF